MDLNPNGIVAEFRSLVIRGPRRLARARAAVVWGERARREAWGLPGFGVIGTTALVSGGPGGR